MERIKCFMVVQESIGSDWLRPDTGERKRFPHQFGAGAMWYADWLLEHIKNIWTDADGNVRPQRYGPGPDGRILIVQTPGGGWIIDSRASNCTMPQDNEHRCWVRHGTAPEITVDKSGNTCGAGAGSIQAGNYHGFLRNGYLEN
jgi:hypothetical protein